MDTVSPRKRSEVMRAVRSKETKLEVAFRKAMWRRGFRYRKNPTKLFGKPDLSNRSEKTVVFVDSCFWHGCSRHCRFPSSNKKYWREKIRRNQERDKRVTQYYRTEGWKVYRLWEHQLSNIETVAEQLIKKIRE